MQLFNIFFFFTLSCLPLFSIETLDHATISIYAVNLDSGKEILNENGDKSLNAASCLKIVTTGAALHLLKPESRFHTDLEMYGEVDRDGTLLGNLIIRGGGDPTLGSGRWQDQIALWVLAVQKAGIRSIDGEVYGDDTLWEKGRIGPKWMWEDVGNYYAAASSALSFHDNSYTLYFKPGDKVGDPTTIVRVDPPITRLNFFNEVLSGPIGSGDMACIYGAQFSLERLVRGTIPLGFLEFSLKGSVPDPALLCADLLSKALIEKGITIAHKKRGSLGQRVILNTTLSPTIQEIVYRTNQESVNLYAEHLLKKMGEVVSHEGSTEGGIKAVRVFFEAQGVDLSALHMVDGAGLSLISAKELVSILQVMKRSPYFAAFYSSLPKRSDHIVAKSGTMTGVKAYAGYADHIAFAIIINNMISPKAIKEKMDGLFLEIERLATSHTER